MILYLTEQLRGKGISSKTLLGNKTFTFTNASSKSVYCIIQTTLNNIGSYE